MIHAHLYAQQPQSYGWLLRQLSFCEMSHFNLIFASFMYFFKHMFSPYSSVIQCTFKPWPIIFDLSPRIPNTIK